MAYVPIHVKKITINIHCKCEVALDFFCGVNISCRKSPNYAYTTDI